MTHKKISANELANQFLSVAYYERPSSFKEKAAAKGFVVQTYKFPDRKQKRVLQKALIRAANGSFLKKYTANAALICTLRISSPDERIRFIKNSILQNVPAKSHLAAMAQRQIRKETPFALRLENTRFAKNHLQL